MEKLNVLAHILVVLCIASVLVSDVESKSAKYKHHKNQRIYGLHLPEEEIIDTDEPEEKEEFSPFFRKQTINEARDRKEFDVGREIRLNCGVRGYPKPIVVFYKDGIKMENNDSEPGKHRRVDVRKTMIRISKANVTDTGVYMCIATNHLGSASLNYTVDVIEEEIEDIDPNFPHWTKKVKMIKTLHAEPAGNTVIFKCIAGGRNLVTRWFKNGNEILFKENNRNPGRLGGYKFRHNYQVITLESVVLSDVGKYRCEVSNDMGSINHTYELDVTERSAHRPHLSGLFNQTAYVGDDVQFLCNVYSDPHPHIKWVREVPGNETDPRPVVLKRAGINSTDKDLQTFTLTNVTLADAGKYSCVAGNSIGISHVSAWLEVKEKEDDKIVTEPQTFLWVFIVLPIFSGMIVLNMLLWYFRHRSNTPKLTPIKNPDCIPRMEHMEEPGTVFGEEIWQKLLFSGNSPPVAPIHETANFPLPFDQHWEISKKNILLHERIDEGFFGQVYRAGICYTRDGKLEKVMGAVKMLKNNRSEKDMSDLITEMDQLKRIGTHINIISLIGICTQEGVLWLITEYAEQGNLRDFLRRNRPTNVDLPEVPPPKYTPASRYLQVPPRHEPITYQNLISASYQVARGMEFLAQKKCVHRDLAARNVLVTNDFVMKIADFGLARDVRSQEYYRKVSRGHLPYKWMAIEAMVENVFTHSTDVWSFGVLLWEVFTLGGSPYPGIKTVNLVQFLKQGNRLEHPQFASPLLYRLMRDCWEEEPGDRPRFRLLLEDLERMLNATTSEDYIDLNVPCDADYSVIGSDCDVGSDIDDLLEDSSRDSTNLTADEEDSDSVFERPSTNNYQNDHIINGQFGAANVGGAGESVPLLDMMEANNQQQQHQIPPHQAPNDLTRYMEMMPKLPLLSSNANPYHKPQPPTPTDDVTTTSEHDDDISINSDDDDVVTTSSSSRHMCSEV